MSYRCQIRAGLRVAGHDVLRCRIWFGITGTKQTRYLEASSKSHFTLSGILSNLWAREEKYAQMNGGAGKRCQETPLSWVPGSRGGVFSKQDRDSSRKSTGSALDYGNGYVDLNLQLLGYPGMAKIPHADPTCRWLQQPLGWYMSLPVVLLRAY